MKTMSKQKRNLLMSLAGLVFVALFCTFILLACPESGEDECVVDTSYQPDIDPVDFVAVIDNSLLPMIPGTRFTYEGGGETIEVSVTYESKEILGVTCTVVRDTVTEGGDLVEDTYDWFAQDSSGDVWYFGEYTEEYEDGEVSTEGSWEAGVDGAQPGIIMKANPQVGDVYRQEYYACEAEDMAEVISLDETVTVPHGGEYTGCLQTREYTPLEPDVNEYKYYSPGVGLLLEVDVNTGERVELTGITTFPPD